MAKEDSGEQKGAQWMGCTVGEWLLDLAKKPHAGRVQTKLPAQEG